MRKQLEEILKLSVEERILLVEAIWDSIPVMASSSLSPEQMNILNERDKEYKDNPEMALSLEEAHNFIRTASRK